MFPKTLQVKKIKHCSVDKIIDLAGHNQVNTTTFDNYLFAKSITKNNLGAIKLNNDKVLYRSAYLAAAPLCVASLAKANVTTVINLYSKDSGYAKQLLPLEKAVFAQNKINNYIAIKGFQFDDNSLSNEQMNEKISEILNTIKQAQSNVLIHCYAGEHDTGLIFALANKCINKQPIDLIEKNLACHMDVKTNYGKKAYHQIMQIIKQYRCH